MSFLITKSKSDSKHVPQLVAPELETALENSALKKIALTCALVLGALVLCEIIARFIVFVAKPASTENGQYQMKYLVAKRLSAQDDNVVLCGDSLMKNGIYPEMVSAKLLKLNPQVRVVNLAVNGSTPADAIIYLRFLEKRGIKPRLVAFDYDVTFTGSKTVQYAPASTVTSSPLLHKFDNLPSRGYLFEGLLQRPSDLLSSLDVQLSDCLYLKRHQGNLKRLVMDFFRAVQFPQRFERKAFFELADTCDAGTSDSGMAPNNRLLPVNDLLGQKKAIWSFHSISPRAEDYKYDPSYYTPIISYCQQHKIPLVLLWLPHLASVYREYYYQAPYTETWFRKQFDDYARQPYVYPIYLNSLSEDFNYYTDYRHLSTYGCVKASELLAFALLQPKYSMLVRATSNAKSNVSFSKVQIQR